MFYETLAEHYDRIFPAEPAKVEFLDKELKKAGVKRVLDLACGTGSYTLALARLGYEAWGTDLEPGMIETARQKAAGTDLQVHFAVGDMKKPQELGITFDGLLCIGNSLAHLMTEEELSGALAAMRRVLNDGGVAVFQVVNFDRILERGDTILPLIERDNLRFSRTYRPKNEEFLLFDSVLELKEADGSVNRLENTIGLRPIRKADLERLLVQAGFSQVRTYGDFRYTEYEHSSQATVTVARA